MYGSDEILEKEDLIKLQEIKPGDTIYVETPDGTGILDFRDFIIGLDNITFFDRLSGDYLTFAEISAISASAINNATILSTISSVSADIINLQTQINSVESMILTYLTSITATSITNDVVGWTNNKVGFTVRKNVKAATGRTANFGLKFDEYAFIGSSLTDGTDIDLDDATDGFKYVAKGSYNLLLDGNFNAFWNAGSAGLMNQLRGQSSQIHVYVNNILQYTASTEYPWNGSSNAGSSFVSFTTLLTLAEGDVVRIVQGKNYNPFFTGTLKGVRI
jgi:hypothetical protein